MSLSVADIAIVVRALEESSWDEAAITIGDTTIAVARNGRSIGSQAAAASNPPASGPVSAPAPSAAPAPPAAVEPTPAPAAAVIVDGAVVPAPSVGVFWRSPQPGSPPFVEVGSIVAAGDTIGIVEVMKLMSNVLATESGVISAIHVADGTNVQYGEALVTIAPSGV